MTEPMLPRQEESLWSQLAERLGEQLGLHYPRERWADLERALAAAAPALGLADARSCALRLSASPLTRRQVEILASHLTVGETYFFREKIGFEALQTRIVPQLLRRRADVRRLRIWSAGCCTGEEPYSIAMLLAAMAPQLDGWHISILATDIDPKFLRKAALGVYGEWSFRDAPPGIKDRFFRRTRQGRYQITEPIRRMVTFGYHNLAQDPFPCVENGTNAMDLILCRNVLMYFEPARARETLRRLGQSLRDDGWLIVNPVEIPQPGVPGLVPVHWPGLIVHTRNADTAASEPALAAPPAALRAAPLPTGAAEGAPPAASPETAAPTLAEAPPSTLEDAVALYERGSYAEAAAQAAQALHQHPRDARALALLARSHANQGRLEEALAWCARAVAADRLNAAWAYLLATILQEQGRTDETVAALRRALYLDPDHALAHFTLGSLMRRQGQTKEAARHFRNALTILSGCPAGQELAESEGMTAGRLAQIIQSGKLSEVYG